MKILITLLIYIAGFGLADLFMESYNITNKYKFYIYTIIGILSLYYYYYEYYEKENYHK